MIHWNRLSFSIQTQQFFNDKAQKAVAFMPYGKAITHGLTHALYEPVLRIIATVECVFKGLANLFAAPFSNKLKASRGLILLGKGVVSIIAAVVYIALLPLFFGVYAYNYSNPNFQMGSE